MRQTDTGSRSYEKRVLEKKSRKTDGHTRSIITFVDGSAIVLSHSNKAPDITRSELCVGKKTEAQIAILAKIAKKRYGDDRAGSFGYLKSVQEYDSANKLIKDDADRLVKISWPSKQEPSEVLELSAYLYQALYGVHAFYFYFNKKSYFVVDDLGQNYYSFLQKKYYSLELRIELYRSCVLCVVKLHALGYIHRDIKPDNFVVRKAASGYSVYLIDLDMVTAIQKNDKGESCGTLTYVHPNVMKKPTVAYLHTGHDYFSLQVMMYVMFRGFFTSCSHNRYLSRSKGYCHARYVSKPTMPFSLQRLFAFFSLSALCGAKPQDLLNISAMTSLYLAFEFKDELPRELFSGLYHTSTLCENLPRSTKSDCGAVESKASDASALVDRMAKRFLTLEQKLKKGTKTRNVFSGLVWCSETQLKQQPGSADIIKRIKCPVRQKFIFESEMNIAQLCHDATELIQYCKRVKVALAADNDDWGRDTDKKFASVCYLENTMSSKLPSHTTACEEHFLEMSLVLNKYYRMLVYVLAYQRGASLFSPEWPCVFRGFVDAGYREKPLWRLDFDEASWNARERQKTPKPPNLLYSQFERLRLDVSAIPNEAQLREVVGVIVAGVSARGFQSWSGCDEVVEELSKAYHHKGAN